MIRYIKFNSKSLLEDINNDYLYFLNYFGAKKLYKLVILIIAKLLLIFI